MHTALESILTGLRKPSIAPLEYALYARRLQKLALQCDQLSRKKPKRQSKILTFPTPLPPSA